MWKNELCGKTNSVENEKPGPFSRKRAGLLS
jgi:hypothetical protein